MIALGTGLQYKKRQVEKESWELNQMHAHVRRIKAAPGETAEPEPELFESALAVLVVIVENTGTLIS